MTNVNNNSSNINTTKKLLIVKQTSIVVFLKHSMDPIQTVLIKTNFYS